MLKIPYLVSVITLSLVATSSHAFDLKSLFNSVEEKAADLIEGVSPQVANDPLTKLISTDLDVNHKDAAAGAGAMLAMAYQVLDEQQSSELLKIVPNIDVLSELVPNDLAGNIKDFSSLSFIFNQLGLNDSMIHKFAPLIIKYLSEHGASSDMQTQLAKLWGGK